MNIIRLTEPNTPLNDADHVGSFNFKEKCQMGDMKQHQPPLTIEEQIENLKSIGLVIKDEEYWRGTILLRFSICSSIVKGG